MRTQRIILPLPFILFILAVLVAIAAMPLYAQGKSNNAPGQTKKSENAVFGNVTGVQGSTLTIENTKNKKRTDSTVDSTTKVVGQDKKVSRLNQIRIQDLVAIISSDSGQTATDSTKPKKALKVFVKDASASAKSKRRAIHGVITGINGDVITIAHQVHQDRIFNLLTNAQTIVTMKGVSAATLADLKIGQRIAAVGDLNADGSLVARRIHVIPGLAKGLQKRITPIASPSATLSITPTISATPSATPTATISATPTSTPSATPTP